MADNQLFHTTPGRVLVALLGVVSLMGCSTGTVPNPATSPGTAVSVGTHTSDLESFLEAVTAARTDPEAWTGLLDPADPDWPVRADWLRTNLAQLDLELEPGGRARELFGHRTAYAVRAQWGVPGTTLAVHTLWMTLTTHEGALRFAGIGEDPDEPVPLWAIEPLRVLKGDGVVALASDHVDPEAWLPDLATARATVARLDPGTLVAQLPGSAAAFERALGVRQGSHRLVAAQSRPFGPAIHLIVNPELVEATTGEARQVLLSHEAVHIATGSARGQRPLWLFEGYADLVALAAHPRMTAAHEQHLAIDQREHGIATALVTDGELAPTSRRVHAHYQRAWLTVRVLDKGPSGDTTGAADRVHAAVLAGTPLNQALAAEGWTEETLTTAVIAELRRIVG